MSALVRIRPASEADAGLWRLTRDVAALLAGLPWVLIGGQMVAIIEAEHGATIGRTTGDVDALLDVRAARNATLEAARRLHTAGFEPDRHADGLTYRFIRGPDIVDVLAPDHVGERPDIRTVPPGTTFEAPGGRQALKRRRTVRVDPGDGVFEIPIPSLVGAIVIKARVTARSRSGQDKHRRDLARLLALVADAPACRAELSAKERSYLRARTELLDPEHPAWRGIRGAQDGLLALAIMGE